MLYSLERYKCNGIFLFVWIDLLKVSDISSGAPPTNQFGIKKILSIQKFEAQHDNDSIGGHVNRREKQKLKPREREQIQKTIKNFPSIDNQTQKKN